MPGFPFMHWSKSCVIFMNFWWLHLSQLGTSALSWELWRLMDGNVYPESSWDLSILSGARTNGREANVPTGRGVQFSSCKFLQERGGLVNQLHLLHDCLVGTHTHICIRIHICVHIPIWMYQHTYTHRHTQTWEQVFLIALPLWRWLRSEASVMHCFRFSPEREGLSTAESSSTKWFMHSWCHSSVCHSTFGRH